MSATAIRKVLVANRGEIARRVIRTCREMGIATVAVFSDADREAPFVAEAHEAVALGGATPAESYLRAELILAAARRTGADAIHPGYGFLAENAAFARACAEAAIVFIGPSAEAIAAMGSKIAAKRLLQASGVPVLPWAEIADGCDLHAAAAGLGFPLLVKASAGGGGKGMRVVREPGRLADAVAAARREAEAAFGDATLLLERYLEAARHVEVQVFGDARGQVVSLFERECSIQRRHQKILEECPSPAVDEPLREALGAAAVAAARAVGYVGSGTVEFLLTPQRDFFFLEMNTRLQVEHPVTECVTGLDLVRLQILVAQGEPLPAAAARREGHAIEARLYAEDPEQDFLPVTGTLHRFRIDAGPGIRLDSGVVDGSVVGVHYDPLIAKLIAHAPTRAEAAQRLAAALARMEIHGLTTNRDLLVRILRHPEFLAAATDTAFLERHAPAELGAPLADAEAEGLHAAAAALAAEAERRRDARVLAFAPSGWRNNPSQAQDVAFEGRCGRRIEVAYLRQRTGLAVRVDGVALQGVVVGRSAADRVELEVAGIRRVFAVHRVGEVAYVDSALGHTALREIDRFPAAAAAVPAGTLLAPMPGVVIRLAARAGEEVEAGAVVAVLEAMKMEHPVTAPRGGRVREVRVREGETVAAGVVLAVIETPTDAPPPAGDGR